MAWTKDSYLKSQEDIFNPQLISQRDQKLAAIKKARDTQVSDLNQQRDLMLPTYTENQNAVDARAARNLQGLREMMASGGLYRSGSMVSETSANQNQANTDIAKIGRDREQFLGDIAGKIGRANTDYTDNERLTNDEYQNLLRSERAKALAGWNTIDEQQRQAARAYSASRARGGGYGGGGGMSASDIKAANTASGYKWINDMAKQGVTYNEALTNLRDMAPDYVAGGVNVNTLYDYLDQVYRSPRGAGTDYSSSYAYANDASSGNRLMGGSAV